MSEDKIGAAMFSFFESHLKLIKGLSPSSIRSYRDALRIFLGYISQETKKMVSHICLADLTFERVQEFLHHLEKRRGNHIRSRNQRLAILHTFFDYLAVRDPQMLGVAGRVAAIPCKRSPLPQTFFLERSQIESLLKSIPAENWIDLRDRALLLFLYNTGARVQEVSDLRFENLDLEGHPRVHLHGKGGKWRTCPLWGQTVESIKLLHSGSEDRPPTSPIFMSRQGEALTRFGIYKIVRRRARLLDIKQIGDRKRHISPHVMRHTTAVHLLEAGVEVNVIRGWLGHVSLDTTNRYAEINIRLKEDALRMCEAPTSSVGFPKKPVWRDDESLLKWLKSL